jgi:hypothetical protein
MPRLVAQASACGGSVFQGRIPHRLNKLRNTQTAVILSEAKNLSLFLFLYLNRREFLRFAQNDKTRHFFRSL